MQVSPCIHLDSNKIILQAQTIAQSDVVQDLYSIIAEAFLKLSPTVRTELVGEGGNLLVGHLVDLGALLPVHVVVFILIGDSVLKAVVLHLLAEIPA